MFITYSSAKLIEGVSSGEYSAAVNTHMQANKADALPSWFLTKGIQRNKRKRIKKPELGSDLVVKNFLSRGGSRFSPPKTNECSYVKNE